MDADKLVRLNWLFEQALNNTAKLLEKRELDLLYGEYINEGRDRSLNKMIPFPLESIRSVS